MAKRTFPEGFKEKAIAYPKVHPEKTTKECAADLGIAYSTLRRWISEAKEQAAAEEMASVDEALVEAAPVLEDVLDEMEPVTLDETEALPEEGAVVEDDLPTEETVVETDQPAEEAETEKVAAEADEELYRLFQTAQP